MRIKTFLTTSSVAFGLIASITNTFGQVNTSDLNAYIAENYFTTEVMEGSKNTLLNAQSGLFLSGRYGESETDQTAGRRFDADLESTLAVLGYRFSGESFSIGASVSYFETELDSVGTDTNPDVLLLSEGDGWLVTLAAEKSWNRFGLTLFGSIGEMSADSLRENGRFVAKLATYDLDFYQIGLRGSYRVHETESLAIDLEAEISHQETENKGFSETVTVPDFVRMNRFKDDGEIGILSAKFSYTGNANFTPYLKLGALFDLGDDEVIYTGFDSTDAAFTSIVPDAYDALLLVEAGFSYQVNDTFSFDGVIDYREGDDFENLGLGLKVHFSF